MYLDGGGPLVPCFTCYYHQLCKPCQDSNGLDLSRAIKRIFTVSLGEYCGAVKWILLILLGTTNVGYVSEDAV